ncbi:hypothetical protein CI41S_63990 [Bradyrhizobium ivorense]|nr:hypothetical protein CI41S_63990 [Bradyrhizobium ivorense]
MRVPGAPRKNGERENNGALPQAARFAGTT